MLGLPAATIKSGPLSSTLAIIISWVYVVSAIILVPELTLATMKEDNIDEVSFTGLATKAFGSRAGIGSIVSQWFPWMSSIIAHTLFPFVVGVVLWFFPFKAIDVAKRFLCFLMLFSLTTLVAIGLSVGRTCIMGSFAHASWGLSSVLPAIPVIVLTLEFHVITPFVCKISGNSVNDGRKTRFIGGFVPLVMVISWNLIVLGLFGTYDVSSSGDPISLLLSISSASSAVQSFSFSALATSFIGEHYFGNVGNISYGGSRQILAGAVKLLPGFSLLDSIVTLFVLGVPVLIASLSHSTFSRALDFAGIYANCFLFCILPPVIHPTRRGHGPSFYFSLDVGLMSASSVAIIASPHSTWAASFVFKGPQEGRVHFKYLSVPIFR
ncbi:unnamed protein product [Ilex paraguariensis]|uniref:Uncharacterized protein n=1 Tax=Ilex paraguariensis TaxID=185542 RepID=A0ABC8UF63_9AQUA